MIRVMQANLNRSKTADSLLHQLIYEKGVDLLLLSEQYRNKDSPAWFCDLLGTAAIWVPDLRRVPVKAHGRGSGFVWVRSGEVTFFSVYLTPNESISEFRAKVDALEDEILRMAGRVVVAGDFNAKAVEWGMTASDSRGKYLLEMAARANLLVLNSGSVSTFRRPGYAETIPDVSFASEDLASLVKDWTVLEDYTGSDHQYILFVVFGRRRVHPEGREKSFRWNTDRMNENRFTEEIAKGVECAEANGRAGTEALVASTMRLIATACEVSMPRKKPCHRKQPAYWWTPEIAELRRRCLRLRRAAQRARHRTEANLLPLEYKDAKRKLRRAINSSKVRCWRRLSEDVNADPWGLGYRIVTQKLGAKRTPCSLNTATMDGIVRALFPAHPMRPQVDIGDVGDIPLFNNEELEKAVKSMRNKRAPGPDGIPSEVLKAVFRLSPHLMLDMYNACLKAGVFSARWKVSRLVLISKGKGDPEMPSSYRPLCMLDTAGKVFEKLIRSRLNTAIQAAGDLSPLQYGFRTGRSTIDATLEITEAVRRAEDHNNYSRRVVLLVMLDVKNAFNSAKWDVMLGALKHDFNIPKYLLRVLDDYLKDRILIYSTEEGQREMAVTAGAAQGSILGPDLWNISYDSLLRTEMPEETRLVGYADDVAALIAARDVELAQIKLNEVMRIVNDWMRAHGLSLAVSKTEIVVLTKKRINTILPLRVGEEVVQSKHAAKYLGIVVDTKMSFGDHIQRTADKAAKSAIALNRLMANVSGPRSSKRRVLMSAVHSILLYGAEVWADAMDKEKYRRRLARVQRVCALRVASAYRTVSEPAVLVIAGVIPVALLAKERKAVYHRKAEVGKAMASRDERARTLEIWQAAWERESRGRWTASLITHVKPWFERKHGEIDFYLTQLLSGHGYFRLYLYRMGKVASPDCPYCPGMNDDVCHTFFACGRWAQRRRTLEAQIGVEFSPDSVIQVMLRGEDTWNCVSQYVQGVLRHKKGVLNY